MLKQRVRAIGLKVLQFTCAHWPRSGQVRRVLLDSSGSFLSATYLEDLRQLLSNDPRLRFFKVVRPTVPEADRIRCLAPLNCPEIPYRKSKFYPWDLVVLADHPEEYIEHTGKFGVLRISHGIGSKLVNGQDFLYGPKLYSKEGRFRYSAIFEASESRQAHFTAANPDLRGIIRLVGDLRIDKLLQISKRAQSRTNENPRPSVVIAGSWSRGNLFEKIGRELLGEATGLLDRYSFVLRPHPHVFKSTAKGNWKEFFEDQRKLGFVLSPPTEDVGWLLAAASVIICDDMSSVVLYAAAMGKRIIIVPSGSDQIPPDSFLARLARIVPNLNRVEDLGKILASVLQSPPPDGLRSLASEINSRPGQSEQLVRQEFYRLLNFEPLGERKSVTEIRQHVSSPAKVHSAGAIN